MQGFGENLRVLARRALAASGRLIPYTAQKPVLNLALNRAFREPLRQGDLDFLDGARIRIRVAELGVDWLIEARGNRFRAVERALQHDVCISGTSLDFILLAARRVDPDTLFFQRRIRIEGDTEMGLGVKNTMDSMDWDDLPPPLRRLLQFVGPVVEKFVARGRGQHEPISAGHVHEFNGS
ncbi:MAG: SCP2 sterol-binding domain-containing protein [Lysobacterales bacterium]|jgi:predicted lipid carrier protein YhbT